MIVRQYNSAKGFGNNRLVVCPTMIVMGDPTTKASVARSSGLVWSSGNLKSVVGNSLTSLVYRQAWSRGKCGLIDRARVVIVHYIS